MEFLNEAPGGWRLRSLVYNSGFLRQSQRQIIGSRRSFRTRQRLVSVTAFSGGSMGALEAWRDEYLGEL